MNAIFSFLGAVILVVLGMVIGFWIETLSTPELPNGFKNCSNCGPSFVETQRFWQNEHTPKKSGQQGRP
jgi:hypothetical protein